MYTGWLPSSDNTGDGVSAAQSGPSESKNTQQVAIDFSELLRVAERFQQTELVEFCADTLASTLNVDNVAARLFFAHAHSVAILKQRCAEFLRGDASRLTAVMRSKCYSELDAAHVSLLLASFLPLGEQWKSTVGKKRERPEDLAADSDLQPPSKDAIKRMKLPQLQQQLVNRRLHTNGSEAELAQRLVTAVYGVEVPSNDNANSSSSLVAMAGST